MGFLLAQIPSPNQLEKQYGSLTAALLIFGACTVAFILLMGGLVLIARYFARRRFRLRSEWAIARGYQPLDSVEGSGDAGKQTLAAYPHVSMFTHASGTAERIFTGTHNGEPFRVFDFSYITGSGKSTAEHQYSVVAVQLSRDVRPLIFRKRVPLDRLRGGDHVLTGNEAFDDCFAVDWDVAGVLPLRLDDEVIERLRDGLVREVFVSGWQLVVTTPNHISSENYDRLIEEAKWLADWVV